MRTSLIIQNTYLSLVIFQIIFTLLLDQDFVSGKSDYTGIRKYMSIFGNFFTVKMLKINLCEITTSYRLYDVNLLKKLPFEKINRNGYSMLVLIVWYLNKLKANMTEILFIFMIEKWVSQNCQKHKF